MLVIRKYELWSLLTSRPIRKTEFFVELKRMKCTFNLSRDKALNQKRSKTRGFKHGETFIQIWEKEIMGGNIEVKYGR